MKEKKAKLKTRDLIYAGAFAAIYLIALFIVVMVFGMIPILYIIAPLIVGIINATIYMMYVSKVKKFGAIFILAILFGGIMSASGHIYAIIVAVVVGLVAELIAKNNAYQSKKMITLSYAVFNLTMVGPFLTMYTATEAFVEETRMYYGDVYAEAIAGFVGNFGWMLLVGQIVLAIIGALIGGVLGTVLFKKHFEKAGLV